MTTLIFWFWFQDRYSSFDKGIGAKVEKGTTSLEELEVSPGQGFFTGRFFYESLLNQHEKECEGGSDASFNKHRGPF